MTMKPTTFAAVLCLALTLPASAQPNEPLATVVISIKPCDFQTKHAFSGAKLQYEITTPNGALVAASNVSWNSNDPSQLHWTTHIPPGVYRYEIYSDVNPSDIPCLGGGSFAVLPGASKSIDGGLVGGIGDPLVPLYIYGTAPAGVKVEVIRFDDRPNCGSSVSESEDHPIDVERDGIGYYAEDSSLSGSEAGENAIIGIRVQRATQTPRTIRLLANYPNENISTPPTGARLDLTAAILDAAYRGRADVLQCPQGS